VPGRSRRLRALDHRDGGDIHWATLGALCEFLPLPDNRVTLDAEADRHGMPVARFSYSQCDNDRQLMKAAAATAESILTAAGAEEVITINRYAHLVGGAGMGDRPETGVVDRDLRSIGAGGCQRAAAEGGQDQPDRRHPRLGHDHRRHSGHQQ